MNNRPIEHLNCAMKMYPRTPEFVNTFRSSRGKDLPKWPDWCFMPMSAFYAIVSESVRSDRLPIGIAGDVAKLAAIGTWRYSQGIYQFDEDFFTALASSPISGEIPSAVLYRLPEWCLYITTPGLKWLDDTLYGFWVHLEWDVGTQRHELRFLLDCEHQLFPVILHLGQWTVVEAIERAFGESAKQMQAANIVLPDMPSGVVAAMSQQINPLLSAILYLCSDEPEIDDERQPGVSPSRPSPKKTKKGWLLFAPDRPRFWRVGTKLGMQLRQDSMIEPEQHSQRVVSPHLRRGHWHGFWSGPLSGERRFHYKWLPPMVVGRR